jgi:hypothetical protein
VDGNDRSCQREENIDTPPLHVVPNVSIANSRRLLIDARAHKL